MASANGDLRAYIERDIGYDNRPIGKVVFIEPIDARDADSLFAALSRLDAIRSSPSERANRLSPSVSSGVDPGQPKEHR